MQTKFVAFENEQLAQAEPDPAVALATAAVPPSRHAPISWIGWGLALFVGGGIWALLFALV
jgi:hypothetical protein